MISGLRAFNDSGVAAFRDAIRRLRDGDLARVPQDILSDNSLTRRQGDQTVVTVSFASKLDAAMYLADRIDFKANPDWLYDTGLWSWLSAFYFDQLCPVAEGVPVGRDYRYVPAPGRDWRHYYRHLLAGPVRMLIAHGAARAKLLLSGPVHVLGDFTEQLASRQYIASNGGLLEAASELYWDERAKAPKRGAASTEMKPGTLRRFIAIADQFDMTYDTFSMTGEQVVSLLPAEFTRWLS